MGGVAEDRVFYASACEYCMIEHEGAGAISDLSFTENVFAHSFKAKSKLRATGGNALNFHGLENATDSRSSSRSLDSGSDRGSNLDLGSISDSGSSLGQRPAPGVMPEAGTNGALRHHGMIRWFTLKTCHASMVFGGINDRLHF